MKPLHFLGLLFLGVGYFAVKLYKPFLQDMFIASLLAMATYNIHLFFLKQTKNSPISAALSTMMLAAVIFAPIAYFLITLGTKAAHLTPAEIKEFAQTVVGWASAIPLPLESLIEKAQTSIDKLATPDIIGKIFDLMVTFGKKSAAFVADIALILVFYFFSNLYGKEIIAYLFRLLPFERTYSETILTELASVTGIVFYSIVATATLQGSLFALICFIYGYDALFFGILYGFASLIPVVGGTILWIPLSLYEFSKGNTTSALIIAGYSFIMISTIADNFIKPFIIRLVSQRVFKTKVKVSELVIFFSIVAGISTFGFWGMILGPAITSLLFSCLRLYLILNGSKETH